MHRRRTDWLWQDNVCRSIAAKFFHNDRSLTRTRYVVLRGMAVSVRESRHTQLVSRRRTVDLVRRYKRNIVVLEDIMTETDERVTNLFTQKSHHCNTSVIYLVQNLFPKNKESRTISLNSQYIVVFKNPRDVSQMTTLAKQMYPGRVKFVQEAFADATSTPYGYILVDLKQDTPEDLRLCTSILPDDAVQYVYMPKV